MPYYEYNCLKCKQTLEILQKISEAPKRKCPECGGKLKKLISNTAFQLKGGGWYADGYSGASNKKEESKKAKKNPDKVKKEKKTSSENKKNP